MAATIPAELQRAPRRRYRWRWRLLSLALAAALGLLICEIGLRLIGVSFPLLKMPDPYLGFRLMPGATGLYTAEGRAWIRINSHGWRDRERQKEKPVGTLRIAVLGDSFVDAMQVPLEQTFCSLLEKRLGEQGLKPYTNVEVLNFGVGGYATAQELLVLRRHVWEFFPDVVLLACLTSNDVKDNSRTRAGAGYPVFVRLGNELVVDYSFRESAAYRKHTSLTGRMIRLALRYSRLVQVFNRVRNVRRQLRLAEASGFEERGLDPDVYRDPPTAEWENVWGLTEDLIALMNREVKDRGARFGVVLITNNIQVHPQVEERRRYLEAWGLRDLSYPNRRIAACCQRENIALLDLVPGFRADVERRGVALHGFKRTLGRGHWNAEGHRLAAELIAPWVLSLVNTK